MQIGKRVYIEKEFSAKKANKRKKFREKNIRSLKLQLEVKERMQVSFWLYSILHCKLYPYKTIIFYSILLIKKTVYKIYASRRLDY